MELKNFFAQDDQGNALPGAACYVYQRGTESPVVGLQKANGVSLLNPFKADEGGRIQFAAPNGLYDLRVVHGARDYRIPVQLNDLGEGIAAVRAAADRAEAARDISLQEAGSADSVEEGLNKTTDGESFQVLSPGAGDYLITYLNQAGNAVELNRYPTANAVEGIRSLVRTSTAPNEHLKVLDDEDAQVVRITDEVLETPFFTISSKDGVTTIEGADGELILSADSKRILLGGMQIEPTYSPGILVVDAEDAILNDLCAVAPLASEIEPDSPFEGGLLFAPVIATAEHQDAYIYPQNMLTRRELGHDVVATLSSTTTAMASTGKPLAVNALTYGPSAVLNLRAKNVAKERRFMTLTLKNVPTQSPTVPIKVLFIGDSIGNRQGGTFLKQNLAAMGIDATFIGTLEGTAVATANTADNGELGECREGWETGDFTNAITDRVKIIVPGEEDAYRRLGKQERWPINPFLRVATAEDDPSIVRSGLVFDAAFYQSRFGLDTPDVVIQALGTNDVRDRSDSTIYDHVLANELIINDQIRKAWPAAKIIRTLPGTAFNEVRNLLWTNRYTPLIRAMQQSIIDRADPKTIIAPLWAMTNPEAAYAYSAVGAANDGFKAGDWTDAVHPIGASRHALYQALAPFVAAAALNLI